MTQVHKIDPLQMLLLAAAPMSVVLGICYTQITLICHNTIILYMYWSIIHQQYMAIPTHHVVLCRVKVDDTNVVLQQFGVQQSTKEDRFP